MRYLFAAIFILLSITFLMAQDMVVFMRSPVGGGVSGCTQAGSADFSSDPETNGNWNVDLDEDSTGFTWDSSAQNESVTASGTAVMEALAYTAAAAADSNMYVKLKITTLAGGARFGVFLRRSSSSSARYVVGFLAGSAVWYYWDGNGANAATSITNPVGSCTSFSNGDVVGVRVVGTGNDTVLTVWKNPSGTTPTDWGDGNACGSSTTDPSTPVDSGTYGGIYGAAVSSTRRTMVFDNFVVGGGCQ